jgi:hypothetical protein
MKRFYAPLLCSLWLCPSCLLAQISNTGQKLLRIESYHRYTTKPDSVPFQRSIYSYPSPTQRTDINYQYEAGKWVEQTRFSYTFDALQRTSESIFERYDPTARLYIPQSRVQNFPRGNSLSQVDSTFTYTWSENQKRWELSLSTRNRFNAKNQWIESLTDISLSGQSFRNRDVNSYDAQGNPVRIENYSFANGQFVRTGFSWQTFKENLLLSSTRYTPLPPADSLPISRQINTYTANNQLSKTESATWDNATRTWKPGSSTTYTYNTEQQLKSQSSVIPFGNTVQRTFLELFYTPTGKLAQDHYYVSNLETQVLELNTKKFYFYDAASSLKNPEKLVKPLQVSPTPAQDRIQVNLPTGAYYQVYSALGQLQSAGYLQDQELDISAWSQGLYLIFAREGQVYFAGKIVKN